MSTGVTQRPSLGHQGGAGVPLLAWLPRVERPILLLRWLALLLVLILHWFDRSAAGVLFAVPKMALVLVGYNGLLLILMRYVAWLRRPLNFLALDTVVATLAVYLTGGYHSSFFVLYVFITIAAALQLELVATVIVSLSIGLIYVAACYVNPAGLQSLYAQYILAAKLLLLLVVAVLCALLLEQLRREHAEMESSRALARRLGALNDLFQELSTSLDLDRTLKTVVEAPVAFLGAQAARISLLDEQSSRMYVAAETGTDGQRFPIPQPHPSETGDRAPLSDAEAKAPGGPPRPEDVTPAPVSPHDGWPEAGHVVAVTLSLDDRSLGQLDVVCHDTHVLTEEDRMFLGALAQEAAMAIRNARLYAREREQVARLRALDRLRDGFVSAVSHELRTPLTCVRTSADLLRATSSQLTEAQVEMVRTIGHHVERLEGLVADLLEMTKLEAGQVTLVTQPTDLRRLVEGVVETLRPLSDRKKQTLWLHGPESVAPMDVDRRRMEQVVTNILSNAIKFTPKRGTINIRLTETCDRLQLAVTDTGPGIPEADQAHIFDKFYIVPNGRGMSGVGLGLYIARQMLELHGGRIWVESCVGEGSTFCFAIPKLHSEERP
jgi:signal transduction histidine kinase